MLYESAEVRQSKDRTDDTSIPCPPPQSSARYPSPRPGQMVDLLPRCNCSYQV
ncbi:hypothetical protein B0O99DRAFT_606034 [Bisporella sp. PMI_857]|nr:hypothetical protein B0O99DRAFT_606034 [Bisporella sp. PMI_857]